MNQTSSSNNGFKWNWNSFVYGGLAPIFIVIGLALLTVTCSRRRRPESAASLGNFEANRSIERTSPQLDGEPNILVIVAGEHHPTHLAKPLS
ncbi:hypothetical protein SESBI_40363 [Sesbania bispinosa]|nr:hypothetical protein SESBI_40363 [Sesbania bispinosa]